MRNGNISRIIIYQEMCSKFTQFTMKGATDDHVFGVYPRIIAIFSNIG